MVAVISNGTAVLGLGNLGARRRQAGHGGQDRAVQALRRHRRHRPRDRHRGRRRVRQRGALPRPGFGGINLEDIKAPECFVIEQRLRELMDIPVFHDDQHGTAIVAAAGLINACHLTGRELRDTKLVVNGAGAAAHRLRRAAEGDGHAARARRAVRHQGRRLPGPHRRHEPVEVRARRRHQGAHAGRGAGGRRRVLRPLGEGRGDPGRWSARWRTSRSSSRWPIPTRRSRRRRRARPARTRSSPPDAATIPNQVNNVLGFPYIFRGALDVRASHDQRGDEDRRRRGAGQARARGRAGRGAFRLGRAAADLRAGIHHPERRSIRG